MPSPSLPERLLEPEGGALHLLHDADPRRVRAVLPRAELRRHALACARAIADAGVRAGDAVVLALPTGEAFAAWLLGALWHGAVPVPVPAPTHGPHGLAGAERLAGVLADCRPALLVVEAAAREAVAARAGSTPVRAADVPPDAADTAAAAAPAPPGRPAFIQYTAGSTGHPKGVVVTLGNLAANLEAIGLAVRVVPEDRVLSWLPLFHDMGLVGTLLFSLYWRLPLFLYAPVGFVLRPAGWLQALSEHRATLSPAPHFAYALCAHKLRDDALRGVDLSAWRLALDGAEPVRAATVRAFTRRLAAHGFRPEAYHPVYGMSEATVAVTFPAPGEGARVDRVDRAAFARGRATPASPAAADAREFVSVGRALPGLTVTVRDPESGRVLPERAVGEVWVEGPSVSPRYHGEAGPDRTALQTGDLGYLAGGALFIVDRLKDVIIHGGANVYPTDVEAAAVGVEGVRRAVAFGAPSSEGTEEVVLAAEARARHGREALEAQVREAVRTCCGLTGVRVVLVPPRALPLTTSGKLMRRRTRERYLAGALGEGGAGVARNGRRPGRGGGHSG